jgi:hypothetical protein
MSSLEAAIAARLKAVGGLTALVAQRIYPQALPDGATLPAVTYSRISTGHNSAMGSDAAAVRARVQVSCWGKKYGDAKDVQVEARKALQRFRGTSASTVIDDIFIEEERDLPREPVTGIYHCVTDVIAWFRE